MVTNAILEPRIVGHITGNFIIPEYQRGYRWTPDHIRMLLNDIEENGNNNYCLQPIVVRSLTHRNFEVTGGQQSLNYELIDGQQRLTSIYLIMKYLKTLLPSIAVKFSLKYLIRNRSEEFLSTLDKNLACDNIDFFHIYNAYSTIVEWFESKPDKSLSAMDFYQYFGKNVKVIWYEIDDNENPVDLFTRLNIGKIPLTNAELVKALFLSRDTFNLTEEEQLKISTGWDLIEKELNDNSYWSFLTNESPEKYPARIELIFNLMANKSHEKDSYYTFFFFVERMKSESQLEIWKKIQEFSLLMRSWYEKRDLYHRVGFLVAIGERLQDLINDSQSMTKKSFDKYLDKKIIKKLNLTKERLVELSYQKNADKILIENVLLLFNVETVSQLNNSSEKYSFEHHKTKSWSLEHIHAQNSEGLNKKEDQQNWLKLHRQSLEDLLKNALNPDPINSVIKNIDANFENITKVNFDIIFSEVFKLLSDDGDRSYMDSISNMALLGMANNAALNNSAFDVKRVKIIEMDRDGEYIPICTRRAFLKYYSNEKNNHYQFWGEQDRKAYLDAMIGDNGIILKYLKQPEIIE
jgi:hypothetical protein